MTLTDIENLICGAENGVIVIKKPFYRDLVARVRKAKRKDLLDRLLAITPYAEKGGEECYEMNREKQIEEMAKTICNHHGTSFCKSNCDKYKYCDCKIDAEALYNAGYRKQSEGHWIENEDDFWIRCSVCDVELYEGAEDKQTPFCPNCGSKMKGGE